MRSGRIIVSFFTLVFILLITIVFLVGTNISSDDPILFLIRSAGYVEEIGLWEDDDGKFFVFLPTYTDMRDVDIQVPKDSKLYIDGIPLEENMTCDQFLTDMEYVLSGQWKKESVERAIEFVKLGNVPTMYIDTRSGDMEYIHKEKGNEEPGSIRLYTEKGVQDYSGELASIKGRGNATWGAPKKPYSITLASDGNLLEMGAAKNWILLANAYDYSHLRNKMTFDFAREIGMEFVPECCWVDLYLNGEYAGLYLLSERNEIHEERVALSPDSFLVSGELQLRLMAQNYPYISTEKGLALRIHDTGLHQDEIEKIWQSVENAILFENGTDPLSGMKWQDLIDMDSWAKKFLLEEVFVNCDGGLISQFFYYEQEDGKVHAGPIWDMDNCLSRGENYAGFTNSLIAQREHLLMVNDAPLYYGLYQKSAFYNRVIELYEDVFVPQILNLLDGGIEKYQAIICHSADAARIRWHTPDWQEDISKMRTFLENRIQFLNDYWLSDDVFYKVHVAETGSQWGCYAIRPGECIPIVYEEYKGGWYNLETGESFDFQQPIYEDMTVYHRESYLQMMELYNAESLHISDLLMLMDGEVKESEEERIPMQRMAPIILLVFVLSGLMAFHAIQIKRDGASYE